MERIRLANLLTIFTCSFLISNSPLSAQQPRSRDFVRVHTKRIVSLVFSPDGKTLASGSLDNTIKLWNVATGKEIMVMGKIATPDNTETILSLAFSPDGKTLASGAGAG